MYAYYNYSFRKRASNPKRSYIKLCKLSRKISHKIFDVGYLHILLVLLDDFLRNICRGRLLIFRVYEYCSYVKTALLSSQNLLKSLARFLKYYYYCNYFVCYALYKTDRDEDFFFILFEIVLKPTL